MNELKRKIQSNKLLALGTCFVLGVVLHYGYGFMRGALSPLAIYIGQYIIDPYSNHLWIYTALYNITYSVICGFLIALIVLGAIQYLLKPTTMLYAHVTVLPYIVLNYWWFISNVSGFMQVATKERIWITLLSPLAAIIMWLLCSLWLVHKNTPNNAARPRAKQQTSAPGLER